MIRRLAEEKAREKAALSSEEIRRIHHELRNHQIELEMKNEELLRSQTELDASRARFFNFYDMAPLQINQFACAGIFQKSKEE